MWNQNCSIFCPLPLRFSGTLTYDRWSTISFSLDQLRRRLLTESKRSTSSLAFWIFFFIKMAHCYKITWKCRKLAKKCRKNISQINFGTLNIACLWQNIEDMLFLTFSKTAGDALTAQKTQIRKIFRQFCPSFPSAITPRIYLKCNFLFIM